MSKPREPPQQPAPQPRLASPWERPDTEFPAVVPVGTMPFDTDGPTAVAITSVLAYSNGFEFFYKEDTRRSPPIAYNPGTTTSPTNHSSSPA
ncbi:MAG: hypothetical protein ACRDP7_47995 [Trebonia sp.]